MGRHTRAHTHTRTQTHITPVEFFLVHPHFGIRAHENTATVSEHGQHVRLLIVFPSMAPEAFVIRPQVVQFGSIRKIDSRSVRD